MGSTGTEIYRYRGEGKTLGEKAEEIYRAGPNCSREAWNVRFGFYEEQTLAMSAELGRLNKAMDRPQRTSRGTFRKLAATYGETQTSYLWNEVLRSVYEKYGIVENPRLRDRESLLFSRPGLIEDAYGNPLW